MKSLLRQMTPNAIYNALTKGAMRFQARQLPDADLRQIALYLTRRAVVIETLPKSADCKHELRLSGPEASAGWGIEASNTRFVDGVHAGMAVGDVGHLKLAWAFAFPDSKGVRSQPAVAGGALFVGSQSGAVYALDAHTGCLYWKFEAAGEIRGAITYRDRDSGGPKTARTGTLYFGDAFANVYAVDAGTGALVWRIRVDSHPAARIAGSPAIFGERIYVPLGSWGEELAAASADFVCCTFRGSLTAMERRTGQILWKHYTIPTPAVQQYRNSLGNPQMGPSGAGIWSAPAIDARRGSVYFTTGNNYSDPVDDNSDAVFALSLQTGELRWKHQMLPGDVYNDGCGAIYNAAPTQPTCPKNPGLDADFTAPPVLVSLSGGGEMLVAGQKSSDIMGLAPNDGRIVWKYRISHDPAPMSGGVWFGMAVDRDTVFVPVIGTERNRSVPMDHNTRLDEIYKYSSANGLYALDAGTGAIRWARTADTCDPGIQCKGFVAAPLAIAGAVFAGSIDGVVRAYASSSGKILWSFDTSREFPAVDGRTGTGGAIWGAGALMLADGMLFVHSSAARPDSVLLAFSIH